MASFGRLLQIVGLIVPPVSILLQLQGAITLGQMLLGLVVAVSAFWIGRIVEGYARR
jgi:F0F1-type ATP synthase membrane subunit a